MSQITSYSWDEENRLIGVVNPDTGTEAYTYAGDGKRRSKDTLDGLITYVWDDENVLQQMDGSSVNAHYTDSPGYWGSLASFRNGNDESFYYLFDQQASARQVLDDSATTVDQFVYRAFGDKAYESVTTENRHQFQGEVGPFTEKDNRVWMRAREYDPNSGSWLSLDPLSIEGYEINGGAKSKYGYSLYAFADDDPINALDPEGEKSKKTSKKGKPSKPAPTCPAGYKKVKITGYGDNAGCSGTDCYIAYCKQCNNNKPRLPQTGDCAIDQNDRVCEPGQYVEIIKADGVHTHCRVCDSGQGHGGLDIKIPGSDSSKNVDKYWTTGKYCVRCRDKKPT